MAAEGLLIERARAKINLTLQIRGRRDDGFHDLESLVCFAGVADRLTLTPGGSDFTLTMAGPGAATLSAEQDNLVLRAARHLAARVTHIKPAAFHLEKHLPIAAGIGGGSADAAAALRLLARANRLPLDDERVMEAARASGSDVPVCLQSKARMMCGVGADLGAPLRLPPLYAVLVNPRVGVETKLVFGKLGLAPGEALGLAAHSVIPDAASFDSLLTLLKKGRNDMEDAAQVIAPVIGHVIAVLSAARGCRLARMSGSGATCFALFETRQAALKAAQVLRRDHSDWWVCPTILR
jgi:4-diphosphocytidyl-2-C-methyl-D-erythritol kinase